MKRRFMRIPFIQKKDFEIISLLNKNTNWVARLNKVGIFLLFTLLVINISTFSSWESNLVLLVPIISMLIGIGGYYIFKKIKFWLKDKFYYRDLLIRFIFNNGLYKEGYSEYEEQQSNEDVALSVLDGKKQGKLAKFIDFFKKRGLPNKPLLIFYVNIPPSTFITCPVM